MLIYYTVSASLSGFTEEVAYFFFSFVKEFSQVQLLSSLQRSALEDKLYGFTSPLKSVPSTQSFPGTSPGISKPKLENLIVGTKLYDPCRTAMETSQQSSKTTGAVESLVHDIFPVETSRLKPT